MPEPTSIVAALKATQEDIEFTAEQEGVSVEEVKRQLGLK